ncbi:MAG: fructose-6-phosphate aldolase [Dissulfurimicrobium sp.]|uniref:fructose-6-phosphate aldolase n=1 Tax=Dissulfurimicrobium sp. TaxID=2022436 RepID=UPI00404A4104
MKFFIDTANLDEIKKAAAIGMVDGVTTNPSLIAREGCPFEQRIEEICSLIEGPVSAEVISTDSDGMIKDALRLAAIAPNVVVKIPMTTEGLKAARKLADQGVKTNVTLIFSPLQALLAAKAGATYVSPFIGRLDDISQTGMELVADIVQIFDNYCFDTEIIVASVRNPIHVLEAARLGADIATIPYKVIAQLVHHPLTDIGLQKFLSDWADMPK